MKKILVSLMLCILSLFWGQVAEAWVYTVKKGDTLSEITVRELGSYKAHLEVAIMNNIGAPYVIYAGDKLEMPVSKVSEKKVIATVKVAKKKVVAESTTDDICPAYTDDKVGADPWTGTFVEATELLKVFVPKGAEVRFSDLGTESLRSGEVFHMVSGKNKVGCFKNGLSEGKSHVQKLGIVVDGKKVATVWQKPECANWILRYGIPEVPVKEAPPVAVTPPGMDLIIPPLERGEKKPVANRDDWDWYVGAGNYYNRVAGGDNHGYYGWTKLRYRPFWMDLEENWLGVKSVGLGGFGFLSGGEGVAAKHYDYSWRQAVIGATAKTYGENSDYDFDLGWGKLWNEGSWMGVEDRDQVDEILLISAHGNFYREDKTALWFPKFELNLEYRYILDSEVKKGTEVDNESLELTYTQWLYKFHLGEGDSFNVSPGINLGLGYEKASEDENFFKFGPAFEFTSYGNNVVGAVSLFNYKIQGDNQWHPISGYVSIDGIWRAYEASQITSPTAEDLGEENQKLLKNPADYL